MKYLDRVWYESMQKRGFLVGYKVDDRVDSDPEGLLKEIYPDWYKKAYLWSISDEDGFFDPPTHDDVLKKLAEVKESALLRVKEYCPEVLSIVSNHDFLAFQYLNQDQYDVIKSTQDKWDRIYTERNEGYRKYHESCKPYIDNLITRFIGMHDSAVKVTNGSDIIMEPSRGFARADKVIFRDGKVIDGNLPDKFGGLYTEIGWENGRYEIGILGENQRELLEFTISCSAIEFFDSKGKRIVEDTVPLYWSDRNTLLKGSHYEWYKDEQNYTYIKKKIEKDKLSDNLSGRVFFSSEIS